MREIKFRAWNKVEKVMMKVNTIYFCFEKGDVATLDLNDGSNEYIQIMELMQFVGLKDKNGVEIYEGDVGYAIRTKDKKRMLITFGMAHAYIDYFIGPYEIIGNIYENPDLLGKEK